MRSGKVPVRLPVIKARNLVDIKALSRSHRKQVQQEIRWRKQWMSVKPGDKSWIYYDNGKPWLGWGSIFGGKTDTLQSAWRVFGECGETYTAFRKRADIREMVLLPAIEGWFNPSMDSIMVGWTAVSFVMDVFYDLPREYGVIDLVTWCVGDLAPTRNDIAIGLPDTSEHIPGPDYMRYRIERCYDDLEWPAVRKEFNDFRTMGSVRKYLRKKDARVRIVPVFLMTPDEFHSKSPAG